MKIVKGFTLIELLVVIAIVGILSAVGIPMYQGFQKNAKCAVGNEYFKRTVELVELSFNFCELQTYTTHRYPEPGRVIKIDCDSSFIATSVGAYIVSYQLDRFESIWKNNPPVSRSDKRMFGSDHIFLTGRGTNPIDLSYQNWGSIGVATGPDSKIKEITVNYIPGSCGNGGTDLLSDPMISVTIQG